MKILWTLVLLTSTSAYSSYGDITRQFVRPNVVNIGSILTFDSLIGKVAKVAIEAAVEDVNSDPDILKGTKLNITILDSHFTEFFGIIEAIHFMETETVAIIGPQSSTTAHVLSYIANELHIPLLSFSATDPTLSPLQFPYFIRTSVNDLFQMSAIADIIKYYGWREVNVIYIDDNFRRNGIAVLSDQLAARSCQISCKAPLKSEANSNDIRDALLKVVLTGCRVFIVHTYPEKGIDIMKIAHYLGMMDKGYVWIATNWLSTLLDTNGSLSLEESNLIQGVITLRIYTQESNKKKSLVSRWKNLTIEEAINGPIGLSTYGLYAYDTVLLLSLAIDSFLDQGLNVSFTIDSRVKEFRKGVSHFNSMSFFNEGKQLLDSILNVSMDGVTGRFEFGSGRNLIDPKFEILNVIGTGVRKVGYWSNFTGLLASLSVNHSGSSQVLRPVIWPGQTAEKPRGWVFPNNGRRLKIGVPNRVSFRDFVSLGKGTDIFTGYCVDVFTAAVSLLPYGVPYELIPYGDGRNNPSNTELVRLITAGVYDAAIGDIAIITDRTRMVDFTQPFIESGLVVVAPVRKLNTGAWAFFLPFSREMWCVTGMSFVIIGVVVWILEHRINDDFRGPPRKQVITVLWFIFNTLFRAHREKTVSALGRLILLLWLFVVLIIVASYTASLSSLLTVRLVSSPIKGIESLMKSNDPIGYQQSSFSRDYLVEQLGFDESRLVPLTLPEDYDKALNDGPKHGGVAAIVDERAYIELFLSTRCEFSIVGPKFTKNGWGFAFPMDSPLAVDMSTAILKLSENGDLDRIHDKWLLKSACSSQGAELEVDRVQLVSFEGLFLISGLACILAIIIHFINIIRQFNKHQSESEGSGKISSFLTFADVKDKAVRESSVRRKMEENGSTFGSNHQAETSSNRKITFEDDAY